MNKLFKIFTVNSLLTPLVSIVLGLIVGAIIMLIGGTIRFWRTVPCSAPYLETCTISGKRSVKLHP